MIGKTILHYKIIEKLGEGGMGVVYLAEDTKLKRQVAIKFLPHHISGNSDERKHFEVEAKAAASLNHPNIATIYAIEQVDDEMFIVMEYVEGKELKELINTPLTPPSRGDMGGVSSIKEVLSYATQIAEGLQAAHEKGIVHRDIKSTNIMITDDDKVKIMDFGLAKIKGGKQITKTGTTVGTIAYMSPEQTKGETLNHKTDLWSFGVVLYEMLTGQLPFKGDYEQVMVYSIINENPEPVKKLNPSVPPKLEQIVNKALRKKPESRYSSAKEISKDCEDYRNSLRAEKTEPLKFRSLLGRIRKPKMAIPIISALIFIIIGSVWFLNRQKKVRWAKEEALPEIEQLVEDSWSDYTVAYKLARETEKYIPNDPKLVKLLSKSSLIINIKTEPSGAAIYFKEYSRPENEWEYLGITPIDSIRLPIGIFRWKIEKEGYETVLAAASTWNISMGKNLLVPNNFWRVLDKKGNIPEKMVRVTGMQTPPAKLNDFFIDQLEVTNKQYKSFINSGGYKNRKYWNHTFIKEGRILTWEETMAEFVDQTGRPGPATWQAGDYPEGQEDYPVSGISWYEASAYAEFSGKSLPTGQHWGLARGEYTSLIQWPQLGGFAVFAPFSNFKGEGPDAVGSVPGITSYGAYDMAGNVREWCWNETPHGRLIRGGAWNDNTYRFTEPAQAPPFDRSAQNGFRCALYPDPEKIPESAFAITTFDESVDFYKKAPVSDAIFQIYKEQFSYDKTPLIVSVEERDESAEDWIHELITFDAAYGDERVMAHLFLPKNTSPPYQTIIYFPGSASLFQSSSEDLEEYYEFPVFLSFLIKNGRAVLYPIYKGTFERRKDSLIPVFLKDNTHKYTEFLIHLVKDFKRSIDYLETRDDIDSQKLGYYGMSWGGVLGAIIPAVENRLKVSILLPGGLRKRGRPEANQINYIRHVKIPTLMLNGKYDTVFSFETSIKPMFDLLGTLNKDKKLILYETDHIPPRNEYIKEILTWLDLYLGQVK